MKKMAKLPLHFGLVDIFRELKLKSFMSDYLLLILFIEQILSLEIDLTLFSLRMNLDVNNTYKSRL